jgi:hypothetical protein
VPRLRVERPPETRRGLFQPAGRTVQIAQAIVRRGESGVAPQRFAVGVGSLGGTAPRLQKIAQVEEKARSGLDREGPAKTFLRTRFVPRRRQRQAQQVPAMGVVRLRHQRLAEHADGRLAPSRLVRYHPEQVECVRLARIAQQYCPISRRRFRQPPRPVVHQGFVQIVRFRSHSTPAPELYL